MVKELLSYQEVEELLETVLHNRKLVKIASDREDPNKYFFVVFKHSSAEDTLKIRFIREQALLQALAEGIPSTEDLKEQIKKNNLIDPKDNEKIEELHEKIKGQRRALQLTKIEGRRRPILDNISRMETEISNIEDKSRVYLFLSAEYKADEEALLYQVWISTFSIDGERLWPSFADFEAEDNYFLRENLITAFRDFNRGLSTEVIRFLARHGLWRIRYTAALKTNGKLFCRELYDLTPDQLALSHWANFYHMIDEMMPDDRPDEEIIKDDAALDEYMQRLSKKREQERKEGRFKRGSASKVNKKDSEGQDLIITAAHPDYMNMAYTEKRISAPEGVSTVEESRSNKMKVQEKTAFRKPERR